MDDLHSSLAALTAALQRDEAAHQRAVRAQAYAQALAAVGEGLL